MYTMKAMLTGASSTTMRALSSQPGHTMKAMLTGAGSAATRALSSQPGPLSAREQALENVWAKQQDEMQLQRLSHAPPTPPKLRDELSA